jgi:hypothetical protein
VWARFIGSATFAGRHAPLVKSTSFRGGIIMASKKKSAAKKATTGKKSAKMRNLSKGKKAITAEQLQAVKGGVLHVAKATFE